MNDTETKPLEPAQVPVLPKKVPLMATGGRPLPIIVHSVDEAYRYAGVAVAAGWTKMSRDQATMAIMHGAEVGLTPAMSLQSIAMIDNRPAIYGDAVPAIALSTGQLEYWDERIEGEGDNMEAVCVIKRRSLTSPIEERFSVEDAKTAQLWGKTNWKKYPKQMLKARARVAFRRAFADAFAGLPLAEEIDTRQSWQTVDNPLGESPRVVDAGQQDVFHEAAPAEPAQAAIDPETGEVAPAEETAPAAAPGAAQAYLAEALTTIINALDGPALTRWWRGEFTARISAGMTETEAAQLAEAYDAKIATLQGDAS